MSAQKVATGVGLAALAALLISVGLPHLLPPSPVAEIEIVAPDAGPAGDGDDGHGADDSPGADDSHGADDSQGDAPDGTGTGTGTAGDSPDGGAGDSPDDDGEDDDD